MRAAALISLIAGVLFPLLLNGQTFTNSLIGIAFSSISVALCVIAERKARSFRETTWRGRVIAALGVLLAVVLLVQLPAAYTFQTSFNRSMEEIRQKRAAPEPGMDDR
jgi:hypothetical protein